MKKELTFAVICVILAIPTYGLSILILFLAWLVKTLGGKYRKRMLIRNAVKNSASPK